MKIIDILNKRANGEKVPNFKYDNMTFIFDEKHGYIDDNEGDSLLRSICTDFSNINAEVEIIRNFDELEKEIGRLNYIIDELQDYLAINIRHSNDKQIYGDIYYKLQELKGNKQ